MTTDQDRKFDRLVEMHKKLAELSVSARHIADDSGLTRREIAERMGHASPSTVQRLLGGLAYNATVETLAKFAWSCGYDFDVRFCRFQEQQLLEQSGELYQSMFARSKLMAQKVKP